MTEFEPSGMLAQAPSANTSAKKTGFAGALVLATAAILALFWLLFWRG
jgi:hypothetical protein